MGKTSLTGMTAALLVVGLGVAGGCQQRQTAGDVAGSPDETVVVRSDVLVEQMGVTLAEALLARQEAGEPMPEEWETDEFAASVIDAVLLQHPRVFAVTQEQEQRMRAGEFDDTANVVAAEQMVEQLEAYGAPLDTVTEYLVDRLEAGELQGAQLELATRLLSAHLSAELEEDDPRLPEPEADDAPDFEELGAEDLEAAAPLVE